MVPDKSADKTVGVVPAVKWNAEEQAAEPLTLKDTFPPATPEAWRKVVEADLKGADFEKKLVWRTLEGIPVKPMYMREDNEALPHLDGLPGFAPFVRGTYPLAGVRPGWQIRQDCTLASPEEVNGSLRDGLARGATAIGIRLDNAARQGLDGDSPEAAELVGRYGTTLSSINGLRVALADIDLEKFPVTIRTGRAALPVLAMLIALAQEQGISRSMLVGSIEFDPVHSMLKAGNSRLPIDLQFRIMADMVRYCAKDCPGIRPVMVNSSQYHNAGASIVQELGYAIAVGAEYMRAMIARGIDVDTAAMAMTFCFPVSSNIFMETAKLRAARVLWAKVVKALGAKNEDSWKMFLHARTSAFTKTTYDPYNNLIRSAMEGFAAAVGGCDSMYVGPFDEPIGRADEFSSRLARNQQLLLREEAHLTKVVDPAAGSYYVENLTDSIGRESWKLFQEIEKVGGMMKAVLAGTPQEAIAQTVAKRDKLVAGRRMPIVGISNYPNPKEKRIVKKALPRTEFLAERRKRLERLKSMRRNSEVRELLAALTQAAYSGEGNLLEIGVGAARAGATIGEFTQALKRATDEPGVQLPALKTRRLAQPFEELRNRADAYRAKEGELPKVVLVPMGPLAMRRARADFSFGFFGAGGFDVVEPGAFEDVDAAVAGILESGACIAVICSDDPSYPEIVPPIVEKVKAAKPDMMIVVAGYPEESIEALKKAGVDEFIHVRADALATLTRFQEKLGIGA
ncbi:MAG: methylmalonyl-CoA mutase [Candidatus Sumerlaeota bacterium]|nr:methylmalonyl-CoA mutase [Candidatus Sumerlaeota bacterium]